MNDKYCQTRVWSGHSSHFYRATLRWRGISWRRVSVCVSITSRYCIEKATDRITQIMPHDSPGTPVFWCQNLFEIRTGSPPTGALKSAKYRWGMAKSANFYQWTICWLRCTTAVFVRQDDGALAERYRPTVINNVRSKTLTTVMFITRTKLTLRPVLIALKATHNYRNCHYLIGHLLMVCTL